MSLSHTDPVGDSVGLGSFCLPRGDSPWHTSRLDLVENLGAVP